MNLKPIGFVGISSSEKTWVNGVLVKVVAVDTACKWLPYQVIIVEEGHRYHGMLTWVCNVSKPNKLLKKAV